MVVKTTEVTIELAAGGTVSGLRSAPARRASDIIVALAHGAGSDMNASLLVEVAEGLAASGTEVLRFNFPYKERGKRAPDRAPTLEATWHDVARHVGKKKRLVIGGKSMGGRYASIVASKGLACDGLVFLGYPLHPARKAGAPVDRAKLRDAHLPAIRAPMLFVSGTRDPLCDLALLRPAIAACTAEVVLHVVEGGDHDLALPKSMTWPSGSRGAEIVRVVKDFLALRQA